MRTRTHAARCTVLLVTTSLALATTAEAGDGVLEINQTCAAQTGCFPGDTAGFPVTIDGTAGRSYRLTSDVTVAGLNTDAIVLQTSSISLDLNGFSIVGPGSCSGDPNVCTLTSGSGSGIESNPPNGRGVSVRNGTIRGMGSFGLTLGHDAIVEGVRALENRATGIYVASGIIKGSTASQNGLSGIFAFTRTVIEGNTVRSNSARGVDTNGSTVRGNSVSDNAGTGIYLGSGSIAEGNSVVNNDDFGISCDSTAGYRGNNVESGAGSLGTVSASCKDLGGNLCNGLTCP